MHFCKTPLLSDQKLNSDLEILCSLTQTFKKLCFLPALRILIEKEHQNFGILKIFEKCLKKLLKLHFQKKRTLEIYP